MKRTHTLRLILLVLVTILIGIIPAAAQDCPIVPCPPDAPCPPQPCPIIWGVFTNPEWLKIDYHRVNVEIDNQIATTTVDMEFVNEGNGLAEGTFLFPIPLGASVDELIMYINGTPIEGRILPADEARSIYDAIVRQYRDPALLEYVGQSTVQANVFPIPPGETRRITITYSQILEVDNGLIRYSYPLDVTELTSRRPVESMSVSVSVEGQDAISTVYSPTHNIVVNRNAANTGFSAGFEQSFFVPDGDFTLYYGLENDSITANLLTYRESAEGDGFFMMLVQPPLTLPEDQIIPRDVILVVDQSGSMDGAKWEQARAAATYVLDNLNESDRFNVILFSTGWRVYSNELEPAANADEAISWVNGQMAEGGTDINGALTTAFNMVEERSTAILFITDGVPTEGETDIETILSNLAAVAPPNARIFSFGVGDDVDTLLLDSIVRDFRGSGSYVRPTERVDEEVASLYSRISAPVLTDVTLTVNGLTMDQMYPTAPLPDLFAGQQLTIVGRYRGSLENAVVTLSGSVNGQPQTFVYDGIDFRGRAGGEPFIARLWATRRIGDLMTTIRLNGENAELVDSIISLSVRYGIITPYTSFLIEEDDILSAQAREEAARSFSGVVDDFSGATGGGAVDAADAAAQMSGANAAPMAAMPTMSAMMEGEVAPGADGSFIPAESPIQSVNGKTFILQGDVWTDTTFEPDTMETIKIEFLSDDYFNLLIEFPELAEFFAVGDRVIVLWEGVAYETIIVE